jgi:hypothetical protein
MSFQKGHQISNELAEVLLTVDAFNITTAQTGGEAFQNQPFVADRNFRVLEVGFTAQTTTTTGTTITVELVSGGASGADLIRAQAIPVLEGVDTTNGVQGQTVSTAKTDGASGTSWKFYDPGLLDSDGVPRILAGQQLQWKTSASAGTGWGKLFVRLAPEITYKD